VKSFYFISLCETWVEEELKGKLPRTHIWECHFVRKKGRQDRTNDGFIVGKRSDWKLQGDRLIEEREGIISMDLVINKERIRVILIYGEQGGKNLEEKMKGHIRKGEERNLSWEGI